MSNRISEDCSSHLHEYCTPCECKCHKINSATVAEAKEELEAAIRHALKSQRNLMEWGKVDALIAAVCAEYQENNK